MLATFTVTRADDGGFITRRVDTPPGDQRGQREHEAVPDTIDFAIPGAGVHTITRTRALPTITDPVIIDGYTQGSQTSDPATMPAPIRWRWAAMPSSSSS